MKEIFFKCRLVSDIVLNSKLATEGNMTTLDYIPGSNFLGIVASKIYGKLNVDDAYSIFHSGGVSFGDAIIYKENEIFYQIPFDWMMKKGKEKIGEDEVYLQHILSDLKNDQLPKSESGIFNAQLKQKRNGYFSAAGQVAKIQKTFALKSAHDANERRSKEGAMFGFESLKKGQEFVFSVHFVSELVIDKVKNSLIGRKRIGKSKTAEYGQVDIEEILAPDKIKTTRKTTSTLVYAQSNLCFFDDYSGQPTFQPTAKQLGLNGKINWKKSQVRTYSYSPWNGKRNTTDTQRNCIAAGSVFYVDTANTSGEKSVGAYQAEGLGRIIINPVFLDGDKDNGLISFFNKKENSGDSAETNTKKENIENNQTSSLGILLKQKYDQKQQELALSKAVQEAYDNASESLKEISPSQWGSIRTYAIKYTDFEKLQKELFLIKPKTMDNKEEIIGYLTYGVAYDKYWGKSNEKCLKEFAQMAEDNKKYGSNFIAKFAAEMAQVQKRKKEVEHA